MHVADFDYSLPQELIAQYPAPRRRDARLLILESDGGQRDTGIGELPSMVAPGDLIVLNDTRVIPARLRSAKETGGAVEILIEKFLTDYRALAQIRASKAPKSGARIKIEPTGDVIVAGRRDDLFVIETARAESLRALVEKCGHVPLPPYIARPDEALDRERYQTVYASKPGAIAAPTAGLHLDREMLGQFEDRGAVLGYVTLHVGAGTFQPLRTDDIASHTMHAERIEVPAALCNKFRETRAAGKRIIAIGTTVVRALETAADRSRLIAPYSDETRLFIRPGYDFRAVDAMLTNFHLPRSTLLMLVCAFGGCDKVMAAYHHAVAEGYRFFSYGDAMWLERARSGKPGE